jgi:sulfur-carrier protein adenylyltransferase/sulfurtransferase
MKEITPQELKALMDSGADFQLIDVREPHEIKIATIGGENIPLGTIMQNTDRISEKKQVIIYCRSGGRSGQAVSALEQHLGQDNLYNLKGGILRYADDVDSSLQKY